jgi:hypothetical protein
MPYHTVILVRQNGLGSVDYKDADFGLQMFDRFLHALESQADKPQAICFYTEGVRLACKGSPVVASLKLIEGMGIRLVSCASCLEHYGLKDKLAAGEVGGMNEIASILLGAGKVITV